MQQKKTPAPRRAGTDHDARFARVVDAAGSDPASLLLMISVMERIIAERRSHRGTARRKKSTKHHLTY
jgi:hypothetical protein